MTRLLIALGLLAAAGAGYLGAMWWRDGTSC